MAKIVLNKNATNLDPSIFNENFEKIEAVLNNRVLFRDNPPSEPNELESPIDANNQRVYNLPDPVAFHEAATKRYVDEFVSFRVDELIAILMVYVNQARDYRDQSQEFSQQAQSSATQAANSAYQASVSENQARNYRDEAEGWANQALENSLIGKEWAEAAEFSANSAASSATQASIYSSMGLGGAVAFDFGSVADPVIIFPTDFGSIV